LAVAIIIYDVVGSDDVLLVVCIDVFDSGDALLQTANVAFT
jgi:hypothetical protein